MKRPTNRPAPSAQRNAAAAAAPAKPRRFGPRRDMLALESRIVFDGAAAGAGPGDLAQLRDGGGHAFDQRLFGLAPAQRGLLEAAPGHDGAAPPGAGRSVLIVDNRVPDYQKIVAAAGAGVIVIVIDKDSDGVEQIAAALKNLRGLESISIVSHGDEGMLLLGNAALVGNKLAGYSAELAAIGAALKADGELLLYGCEAGAGAEGRAFLEALAGMTGAVVAASSDATGGAAKGGDWDLEIATGTVNAGPAFDAAALAGYEHQLFTASVGTLAALKAAIASGNTDGSNDLITLTANITFSAADTTAIALNVTDNMKMTIVGGGFTIDAAYRSQAMTTATSGSSSIEIQNLTITHGLVSGIGGNTGDGDATITVNGGNAQGGAIFNSGTLTLNGVTVTANSASGGGGGGGIIGPALGGGGGGGGGSGSAGVGGAKGGSAGVTYPGSNGGGGAGGAGGGFSGADGDMWGNGGSSTSGGGTGSQYATYTGGGDGGTAASAGITVGGGGGGAGYDDSGGHGGGAAGAIYNSGTLSIIGTSVISNNIGAGGGGGGGGGAGNHAGTGGLGVGGIWNATGATLNITAANFAAMTGNDGTSGTTGEVRATATASAPIAPVNNVYNGGGTLNTAFSPGPTVTDARISIGGATGTGGAYKIGDTVTATWNNTAAGDNNAGVTGATVNFTAFGGGAAVAATNAGGVWSASYTITAGSIDNTNRNVSFTATNGFATTTADSSNATVDNIAPVVTANKIGTSGATAAGGDVYKVGDTVTAVWNNGGTGDNNLDTISSVGFDFSQFGAGATPVMATLAGTNWTASYTITAGNFDAFPRNVIASVTDNAGNVSTVTDNDNTTVHTIIPSATIVVADSAMASGETSLVTITFTEAVTGFTLADLTAENGTLNGLSTGDGGVTYTATFTAAAGVTDASNVIRLASASVADTIGNTNAGVSTSNNYTLTAAPSATIVVSDTALKAGETSVVTITFSEPVSLFDNTDLSFAGAGTLSPVASTDGGITWTAAFTPTANFSNAANVITLNNAGVVNGSATPGVGTSTSNTFAVDTVRPDATIVVADSALAAGETSLVTITFTEAVSGLTLADLLVANGSLSGLSTADNITWNATFTPTPGITDTSNALVLNKGGVADAAGNTGTDTASSNNYAVDTARPTVVINIADATLGVGETALVTFTFSEAVTGFTNADLTVENGLLTAVGSTDGGKTWTATLTPTAGVVDATNLVRLTNTGLADLAGNTGFGTTASNNYTIDGIRPTATIVVADNALLAGETSLVTITFSEAVTGFDSADLTVSNGTLGPLATANGGITWTATFTPTAATTAASNLITLANTGVADLSGNAGSGSTNSNNYAIDTARPTVSIVVADNVLSAGQTSLVTFTFSEAVTGFTNADLAFSNGTLSPVATADAGITWTATFTPTAATTDTSNVITLANNSLLDVSGNANSGSTDSNNYAVVTAGPTATITLADSSLTFGESTLVTFTFSEAVTGFTDADISPNNGFVGPLSSVDGVTWTALYTPTSNIESPFNLIRVDNSGVTGAGGSAGTGFTDSANYAIDTLRPTATVVVADNALRAGETSLVTITFSESVTNFSNADLAVAGGTLGAVISADGGFTWSATFTPAADTTSAGNLITLSYAGLNDIAGNVGTGSTSSNSYAIDTARPTVSIAVADNMLSAGETSLVTFTFSEAVTGFTNGDLSLDNGNLSPVTTGDGGITWTATFTPTAATTDTTNLITLTNTGVLDAAGNAGSGSTNSNNYAVVTAGPTATIVLADSALTAGESTLVTITFSQAVTGFSMADISVPNGTLDPIATGDLVTWVTYYTPTAGVTDASNVIRIDNSGVFASVGGSAGSGFTDSANFTIDTLRPNATIVVADSALSVGETSLVTITFTEPVTGFTNTDLTVANGTLSAVSSGDFGTTWTATFTPTAGIAATGNLITLNKAGVSDGAGNAGSGSASSNTYAVDTARPTATIVVADSALAAGESSLVTFTFSEAVSGFTNADLSIANGTLSAVATLDGGQTWTATFTPTASTTDASNLITLNNTGVLDAAGNAGSGATSSNNYAIDTARPAALSIVVADSALRAGESSLVTFTFTEAVSGFDLADLTVANGTLGPLATADNITWTATFTPNADTTDTGNLITLANSGVIDAAGNSGSASTDSNNYAIDTKRPTATIVVADSVLSAGETSLVTITFSEAVTSFTLADLTAANGTISGLSSGDGGVTWTATFTPAALTTAPSNVITLVNTGVLDAASNNGSGSTNSNNYAVVTAGPTNTITVADSSLTVGESTLVTFTFSEAVTGFDNADISVPNGTLGNVSSVDGITYTATFTPTAGITSAANMITVDNTGVLGGGGSAGAGTTASNSFAIDTLRPSATIAVADNALKVGETSLVTITFTEPVSGFDNSDLTVANGTLSAVGSVDGGITWTATFTPTAGIADTSNLITLNQATLVDAAGNAGSGSASSNNYAIDTAPPTVTIVVADNALASGETSLVTFTFSEPVTGFTNADLSVANGTLSAVATLDGGQTWTATFTPTASTTDASNLITLSNTGVLDAAGNAGIGATSSNNYAIDNVRPTATIVVADTMLLAGETSLVTITFSEVVTGFALSTAGGSISGVTSADGGMTWTGTFTPTANIDDASNLITLDYTSVTDAAGNEGSGSTASNNYEIATKRPTVAIVVADGTLTAGETSLVTFTFSEPVSGFSNADLTVASGTLSPVSSSDGGITWTATFTPTALTTDTSNVITVANGGLLDASGNAGSGSTDSNNYAVLTAGPTATIVVADTALAAGESTLVTFTFSLPATGFDNADISVSNGTLSAVSSTDGGITWTATFTPTAGVNSPANLITLDNTGVFSSGGSPGTGTTSSNSFAIETTLPDATIVVADGALNFGETSLVTITFTEPVVGFDNADLTVANGTLSAVGSIDGGVTWTATFTPTAGITDTSNLVTLVKAGLQDAAGNAGTGSASSNNYAIDTARPSVTIVVADSALAAGETALVTFMFSEPVTGFSNADLAIANGSLGAVNSSDGGLTWSATFTPAADTTDTGNLITLANGGVFDLAGNAGSGTTDSNNFGIDTARPSATIVVADGALAAGETSLVTITFSEAVTGLTNTDLAIANGGLGALASSDGGITWTATFTPAANVTDTGNLITLNNAGVADLAGNLGAGSTDSNNYAIDTARPTVAIVVADSALSIGETTLVTFTFSEAVAGFTNADLTVANGALGAVASIDGGLTWTATFTPTANLTDTSNLVTLNNTGVADLAGNIGAGSTDSNNYSIDTARPTVGIVVADSALSAGESTLVTFTFSEAVTGFTNADLTVANGILGAVSTSNGGITWTATFTPNANVTDTTNLLTLANTGILDQAGNAGAGSTDSNNYAIDTARPTAAIVVADTALSVGESTLVTFTFSEAVAGFTNADLTVANGSLGPVASTDGGITWTATFTPSANVTDTSNLVTLNNSGVTDLAGNAGAGSTVSNYYAIDTMRPTAVITVADGALFVGETSLVTITFSEAVSGFTNADLAVANGALGAVSSSDGGLTWSATFTPTANVADASNLITLANAGVQDAAGNAGAGATDSNNYAIDTVPAATPGAPQLAAASDSGSSNSDRITNDNTPTITGSAADGTTVTLYDSNGVTVLGTAVASGGLWSITSSALSDGNHTLTAIATKGGFNASARSSGLQVTIDTIAPAAPGRPATADGSPLTHNRTPVFNGAGAEANAVITIRNGASAIGTAQADASGNWTSAPIALANGSYQITASATDAAGNTSAPSEVRALRIAAPPQPVDPRPPHAEHDDSVFSDAITGFDDQFASIGEGIASPFERSPLGATIDAAMGRGNGEGSGDGTFRLFDLGTATGGSVVFTLPANLFGGRELVSIRATLPGGQPLPLWLHFDAASRTFSGELPVGALSFITVELVAVDKDGKELRATLTLGGEPAADGQPAQNQSGMSGLDLLKALGIKGLERGDQATPQAAPRETDTAAHARHLSGQLDKQAQRFARGSDATMRHLEQIEQKNIARPHA